MTRQNTKGEELIMNENNETSAMPEAKGKRFNWRGFFSLLLFGASSLLAFSGIILYVTPKGRVAHWTGWTMLGLEKEEWSSVHITLALIVLIASAFHLYYNWTIFWGYIRRKAQRAFNLKAEMTLAALLCLVTFFGTLYGVPPFSTIIRWNDEIKDYWEIRSAPPPLPHAEELSIKELALAVDMPLEEVLSLLEKAGVKVDDPAVTVDVLARKHRIVPNDVYAIIRPETRGVRGSGAGGGRGLRGAGAGAGTGLGRGAGAGLGRGEGDGLRQGTVPMQETVPEQSGNDTTEQKKVESNEEDVKHTDTTSGAPAGGTGLGRGDGTGAGAGLGRGDGTGAGLGRSSTGRGQSGTTGSAQGYGRMTIRQCCEKLDVPLDEGLSRLKSAGIDATGDELLRTIAARANKTPSELAQIVGKL